jgi:pimeloyl-ACP methyl ester carboxylesterase
MGRTKMKLYHFVLTKALGKLLQLSVIVVSIGCSSLPQKNHRDGSEPTQLIATKQVVFIHGMFMTPDCWNDWVTYFSKQGFQVANLAWPNHDLSIQAQRDPKNWPKLAQLQLEDILDHLRNQLRSMKERPIIIGHSLGGLIAQILAGEGLASAVVAIHPAPPNGLITFSWPFLRSNWGIISPFASLDEPINLDLNQFSYRFTNAQSEQDQRIFYEKYYVPESRRAGRDATGNSGEIDPTNLQVPLLLISGSADHIIPDSLVYKNYNVYLKSPGPVDYLAFSGRDHFTIGAPGWEQVADASLQWIDSISKK